MIEKYPKHLHRKATKTDILVKKLFSKSISNVTTPKNTFLQNSTKWGYFWLRAKWADLISMYARDISFSPKMNQIGPEWDKSGTSSDQT